MYYLYSSQPALWTVKKEDGHSFAFHAVQVFASALDPKCVKEESTAPSAAARVGVVLELLQLPCHRAKILRATYSESLHHLIGQLFWSEAPAALEPHESHEALPASLATYLELHRVATDVLLGDNSNQTAKSLLQVIGKRYKNYFTKH